MNKQYKKLTDYTTGELQTIKDIVLNAASYGFNVKNSAALVGLSPSQLQSLLDTDSDFSSSFEHNRVEGIKNASAQMHDLASKGSYQALSFLLSRDENSPYSDKLLDPKQQAALEMLLSILSNKEGIGFTSLLPPSAEQLRKEAKTLADNLTVTPDGITDNKEE